MGTRRAFIRQSLQAGAVFTLTPAVSEAWNGVEISANRLQQPRISLAQWSLHRAFEKKDLDAIDFASIAKDRFGIDAIEYVNGFYPQAKKEPNFWQTMKTRADEAGVRSLLIMVDNEGDLGNLKAGERQKAVENHYQWVDAAQVLGCHSIRVNAFGDGKKEMVKSALIESMWRLADYAEPANINILIENHGLYSSDASWVVDIIKTVDMPNFGTLPDFGNWCMSAKWGSIQGDDCKKTHDLYDGVKTFMPYAKGVSAKSYDFDSNGHETRIDYFKMLQMVKSLGFDGYVGIEYEGKQLSEPNGIRATKNLIEKAWNA